MVRNDIENMGEFAYYADLNKFKLSIHSSVFYRTIIPPPLQ